jgi:hypothetical protein
MTGRRRGAAPDIPKKQPKRLEPHHEVRANLRDGELDHRVRILIADIAPKDLAAETPVSTSCIAQLVLTYARAMG